VKRIPIHLAGAALFLWPFFGTSTPSTLVAFSIVCATVLALALTEHHARVLDSRALALLAGIAAVDSALRALVVNGIGGFSPVFFLILCAGYSFGPSYGFLCGSFTLLVSSLVTGEVGPWLPYEMLAAGWMGVAAGLVGIRRQGLPTWRDVVMLATVGLIMGWVYGAMTDLWDWTTFYRGIPNLGWAPGMTPAAAVGRFVHFYLVTSLGWDTFRAVGDVLMVACLGLPLLAAFYRIRRRLSFTVTVAPPVTAESSI
jgi:energy-coupling factor transport system substrate-specific component